MSQKPEPKIGAGHLKAMGRQGLAELRGAMYADSNVAQPTQYGIYGTSTPGEVQDDREASGEPAKSSIVNDRLEQAEHAAVREPEPPEIDRD